MAGHRPNVFTEGYPTVARAPALALVISASILAVTSCSPKPTGMVGGAWISDSLGHSQPNRGLEIILFDEKVDQTKQAFLPIISENERIMGEVESSNKKSIAQYDDLIPGFQGLGKLNLSIQYDTAVKLSDGIKAVASQFKLTTVRTDIEGKYSLTGLHAGSYRVLASFRSPEMIMYWSARAEVKPDTLTHLDFSPENKSWVVRRIPRPEELALPR